MASGHVEIPLDDLVLFPNLATVHALWVDAGNGALPRHLDPLSLPRALLPYVMLLDLEADPSRLRVRLAGTFVCEKHGTELKGKTTDDFFHPDDAQAVVDSAARVAKDAHPSLATRRYVALDGELWRYTRLILPLSRDGQTVDSFFKVLDPTTLSSEPDDGA
ncbi:MAG: PAS domain-containing protein [Inquilinaceae bacterium]